MADIRRIAEILLQVTNASDRGVRAFVQAQRQVEQSVRGVQTTARSARGAVQGLGTGFAQSGRQARAALASYRRNRDQLRGLRDEANQASQALGGMGRVLGTLGAAVGFGAAVNETRQFSAALGEVSTLVDSSVVSNADLNRSIRTLSDQFGTSQTQVARGLYQAISAGATAGAQANELMTIALQTAIGGVTTVEAAVDGLTTVINAWGRDTISAREAADILFTTMRNGKTTVDELSRFMAQAAPIAAATGVSFQELSGAMIAITLQGTRSRIAFTQIRAAIASLARDTPELAAVFERMGFASAEAAIQGVGFQRTLQAVSDAAGGTLQGLQTLVGSVEAAQAILQLTGRQGARLFQQGLDQVANSAGAAEEAFQKMDQTLDSQVTRTLTALSNLAISVGQALTPLTIALLKVVEVGAEMIRSVFDALPGASTAAATAIGVLVTALVSLRLAMAAVRLFRFVGAGGLVGIVPGATGAARAVGALTRGVTSLGLAVRAFTLLTPVGIITALATAAVILGRQLQSSTEAANALATQLERIDQVRADLEGTQLFDQAALQSQFAQVTQAALAGDDAAVEGFLHLFERARDRVVGIQDQIAVEQARVNRLIEQSERELDLSINQIRRDREQVDIARLNAEIVRARTTVNEKIAEERRLRTQIRAIQEQRRQDAQALQDQIDAIGAAPVESVTGQANVQIGLLRSLAEEGRKVAAATEISDAEASRRRIVELAEKAKLLQSDSDRFLALQRIQAAEQEAARRVDTLAISQTQAALNAEQAAADEIAQLEARITKIEDFRRALDSVGAQTRTAEIEVDIGNATRTIAELQRRLADIRDRNIVVRVLTQEGRRHGGIVSHFARGALIPGYGGGDTVNAKLERGEMVVNKERTSMFRSLLLAINSGSMSMIQTLIDRMTALPRFQGGGEFTDISNLARESQVIDRVQLDLRFNSSPSATLFGSRRATEEVVRHMRFLKKSLA